MVAVPKRLEQHLLLNLRGADGVRLAAALLGDRAKPGAIALTAAMDFSNSKAARSNPEHPNITYKNSCICSTIRD